MVLTVEEAARISYYCLWHDENEMYVVFNRHIHKYVSTMNNEDVLKATMICTGDVWCEKVCKCPNRPSSYLLRHHLRRS